MNNKHLGLLAMMAMLGSTGMESAVDRGRHPKAPENYCGGGVRRGVKRGQIPGVFKKRKRKMR